MSHSCQDKSLISLIFPGSYKMLDRLDQDRKLMLFQHLGFVHCPIREHCPAFPNCMDALIERIMTGNKALRYVVVQILVMVPILFVSWV